MLIGITGLKGSGKSVVANLLIERGFQVVKFAGPLKAMMRAIGLTERHIEGDLKEARCDLLCGETPRYAMQTLGTEWGRGLIGNDLWVNLWKHQVERLLAAGANVVCDDVRFPNEARALRSLGGTLLLVERPSIGANDRHESERHIPDLPWDAMVINDRTIDELREAAREMLNV